MILAPKTPVLQMMRDLVLVPFEYEDLPLWYAWRSKERVARFMGGPLQVPLDSIQGSSLILSPWPERTWQWMLRGRDNTPIGSVSVWFGSKDVRWGETLIGPDELAGRGIGSSVKRAVLDHLFRDPKIEYVRTWVNPANVASQRFNRKFGAVLEPDGHLVFHRP